LMERNYGTISLNQVTFVLSTCSVFSREVDAGSLRYRPGL
jgi:hypothetical protein